MSTQRIEAQLRNIAKVTRMVYTGYAPPSALELIPLQAESARIDLQRLRGAWPATIRERLCAFGRGLVKRGCV